jgi:hypothetical protein
MNSATKSIPISYRIKLPGELTNLGSFILVITGIFMSEQGAGCNEKQKGNGDQL